MKVYIVCGGCIDDFHIIDVYTSEKKAEKRATEENEKCDSINAYVETRETVK